jgi:hypothetical protein
MSIGTDVTNPVPPLGQAQEAIRLAQEELKELLRQRIALMRRLGTVKQTLTLLANTFGDDILTAEVQRLLGRGTPRKQPGFTRACRIILMEAASPLDARQGLREMQRRFPELVEHLQEPLASVTTVFNRLVGYGEACGFRNAKGRRVWEWSADPSGTAESLSSAVGNGLATSSTPIAKEDSPDPLYVAWQDMIRDGRDSSRS